MRKDLRRFGVELEFNTFGDPGRRPYDRDRVNYLLNSIGLPEWGRNTHHDGSEFEVDSPVLQGANGFKQLKKVLTAFNTAGYSTNNSDGLHIHHDAPEFVGNKDLCVKLVDSWDNNLSNIDRFVAARRRNRGSCPHWTANDKEQYKRAGNIHVVGGPRGSLNLWSLRKHGTIELRLHEGTLNYDTAYAWIKFGQSFIDAVVKANEPLRPMPSCFSLLEAIKVPAKPRKQLLTKAHGHRTPIARLGGRIEELVA